MTTGMIQTASRRTLKTSRTETPLRKKVLLMAMKRIKQLHLYSYMYFPLPQGRFHHRNEVLIVAMGILYTKSHSKMRGSLTFDMRFYYQDQSAHVLSTALLPLSDMWNGMEKLVGRSSIVSFKVATTVNVTCAF